MSLGDALSNITLDAPERAIGLGYVKTPPDALPPLVQPVGFPVAPLSNDAFASRFGGAPVPAAMTTSKAMPPSRQDTFSILNTSGPSPKYDQSTSGRSRSGSAGYTKSACLSPSSCVPC